MINYYLFTECSSEDKAIILDNYHSKLYPMKVDDKQLNNDQQEH